MFRLWRKRKCSAATTGRMPEQWACERKRTKGDRRPNLVNLYDLYWSVRWQRKWTVRLGPVAFEVRCGK
jgi:hypothetical protein